MIFNRRPVWIAAAITTVAAAITLVSAYSVSAASSDLLDLVPADAAFIAGAQVDDAKASAIGQQFLLKLQQAGGLEQLKEHTGVDPTTDISEILVAGTGPQQALILVRGNFQPSVIFTEIENATGEHAPAITDYRGVQLLRDPQGDQPFAAGFLNASLAIAGSAEDVEGAIDRWLAGGSTSSPLIEKAAEVSQNGQFWSVSSNLTDLLNQMHAFPDAAAGNDQIPPQLAAALNLAAKVQGTSGSLALTGEGVQISGEAEMTTAEDAQAVTALLTFAKTMARPPNAPPEIQEHLNALANAASFTANGNTVEFSMLVPQEFVDRAMTTVPQPEAATRQVREQRRPRQAE